MLHVPLGFICARVSVLCERLFSCGAEFFRRSATLYFCPISKQNKKETRYTPVIKIAIIWTAFFSEILEITIFLKFFFSNLFSLLGTTFFHSCARRFMFSNRVLFPFYLSFAPSIYQTLNLDIVEVKKKSSRGSYERKRAPWATENLLSQFEL